MSVKDIPTADLERLLAACTNQCVNIVNMPQEQRCAPGEKGAASPEQAGTLSVFAVLLYARELERRGVDTGLAEIL